MKDQYCSQYCELFANDLDDDHPQQVTRLDRVDVTDGCAAIQRDRLTSTSWGNGLTRTLRSAGRPSGQVANVGAKHPLVLAETGGLIFFFFW